jgi:FkbM family methyltransferase
MHSSLKRNIQHHLTTHGLYHRAKASILYDIYWTLVSPSVIEQDRWQMHFYRHLLDGMPKNSRIFDIGANQGSKTRMFLRLGTSVIAVDPDGENIRIIQEKFIKHRVTPKPVTVLQLAVSDRRATELMWMEAPGCAKNTLSSKWVDTLRTDNRRFGTFFEFRDQKAVQTTTLDDLIGEYGMPFFVKIDVEGYELQVLRGMRRPVPYLSFEVNLPEFLSEGLHCIDFLASLDPDGRFNIWPDHRHAFAFDVWLRPEQCASELPRIVEPCVEVFWRSPAGHKAVAVP